MSTASVSYRPVLSVLVVVLPALPVIALLGVGVTVSLALDNGAIPGWTALTVAALDAFILGAFVVGGRCLRPLTETSPLAQFLAPFGRFVTGALGMVVSGFFGAIIAINVATGMAGSSVPGWTSEMLGVVIGAAGVLGPTGSAILLGRRVLTLKPGARAKSLKRGVRRLCRTVQAPAVRLDERGLLVRHLTTTWYLLWLVPALASATDPDSRGDLAVGRHEIADSPAAAGCGSPKTPGANSAFSSLLDPPNCPQADSARSTS